MKDKSRDIVDEEVIENLRKRTSIKHNGFSCYAKVQYVFEQITEGSLSAADLQTELGYSIVEINKSLNKLFNSSFLSREKDGKRLIYKRKTV